MVQFSNSSSSYNDAQLTLYGAQAINANYNATSNMKLVKWPLMGELLHLVQRRGDWAGRSPPSPLLAVPNVTAHPSAASVPITVLLYNGPLLCGFNVPI